MLITTSQEQYHSTVKWFLEKIRPLFFFDLTSSHEPGSKEHTRLIEAAAAQCSWLVPGIRNLDRFLPYTTFLSWFKRLMRNVVGLVCDPHNFRHGQASLLYHAYPEKLEMIARRLGDRVKTVIQYYAWVHTELSMREGQNALVALIPDWRRA